MCRYPPVSGSLKMRPRSPEPPGALIGHCAVRAAGVIFKLMTV
jgi:hypothetical protein